jgi:pre-rRNA-processing protein IPI3
MEIKALERMRAGRVAREVQECTIVLGRRDDRRVKALLPKSVSSQYGRISHSTSEAAGSNSDRVAELEAENKRLKSNLDKAVKLNEKMWSGIVDLRLVDQSSSQD